MPTMPRCARSVPFAVAVSLLLAAPGAGAEPLSSAPRSFESLPDATVFLARTAGHPEPRPDHTTLWRTDGTAAGTVELRVCSSTCDPQPRIMANTGELVFFTAYDDTLQWQMWRTDGTQAGTLRMTDFQVFSLPPEQPGLTWVAGRDELWFVVEELAGWAVWASDGTAVGTRRVVAFPSAVQTAPFGLVEHDGAVYFFVSPAEPNVGSYQLWRSGGTSATTSLVTVVDAHLDAWDVGPALSLPAGLIFAGNEQGTGTKQLWVTDGTAAGTGVLAGPENLDFTPNLERIGDRGWFWAFDATGRQLWTTDGSAAGTRRLTSILPGGGNLHNGAWDPLPWKGGVAFGTQVGFFEFELWASDGTPEGTGRLVDLCGGPCFELPVLAATTEDRLYFSRENRLWESDGTPAGTRPLTDFPISMPSFQVPPVQVVGEHVFFRGAESQQHFEQVWALERATGELRQVTDFGAFSFRFASDSQVGTLTGDRLLFAADDGVHGLEPWISDGTPEGTRLLADIAAGNDGFPTCFPTDFTLCLGGNRFSVEVAWNDHHNGGSGAGRAVPAAGSDLTGYFWFFQPDNIELIVKVLDGTSINDFYWTFYGALTDVEYELTVTDTVTGEHRTYHNPPGEICGEGDTSSLPGEGAGDAAAASARSKRRTLSIPAAAPQRVVDGVVAAAHPAEACVPDAGTLCLLDGRFRVRVEWQDQHNGGAGSGGAIPFTDVSGFFWFFTPDNVELVVKALDARVIDGHYWFFYGALSDVGYTITVEDLVDGHRAREYVNPPGEICGEGDTAAFTG